MSDIAIKVENISKRYRIGLKEELHDTFIGALTSWARYPLSNLRRLQKLSKFSDNGESEDIIWALKDVSFEVKHGEVLGIIGRNGAGKSTLLKILSRITKPTSGRAKVNGRVASLLELGTGFHPELTGRENVYLNGAILGMTKAEIDRKFDEIVHFSEIEKFIDTPVKRYSSGMRVRLGFAIAAHLEPDILLVDEVLAAGDAFFQKKCSSKMGDVAKEGRIVFVVSHNMEVVQHLCSRVILLEEGLLMMDDLPDIVIQRYLKGQMDRGGENLWSDIHTAPGNDAVRVCALRVKNQDGQICTSFDVRDPVFLEIEYLVLREGEETIIEFFLYDGKGRMILVSKDNLDSPWRDSVCPKGLYRAICHIPGDFLNEGAITFGYALGQRRSAYPHVVCHDALMFYVSDRLDPGGVRGNWPWKWHDAAVRVRLHWTVEHTPLETAS